MYAAEVRGERLTVVFHTDTRRSSLAGSPSSESNSWEVADDGRADANAIVRIRRFSSLTAV